MCNEIDIIGNYSKSNYQATNIVGKGGLAPTVRENHGQVTAITIVGGEVIVPEKTIKGYNIAHSGDGIYTNRPHQKRGVVQRGMTPTIKTQNNDIGVVMEEDKILRIRKLTPKECGRLQGLKNKDINNVSLSNSGQYHIYGDAICISVAMSILGKLLNIDYEKKIDELIKDITTDYVEEKE